MPITKKFFQIFILLLCSFQISAQNFETRYAIETKTLENEPKVFEENFGALKLNNALGDLSFTTNLANLITGNKKIDSVLAEREQISFYFQANILQNLNARAVQENDNELHRITGSITVNTIIYPCEAFISIKNLQDKSSSTKLLIDLRFEVDPKTVIIPVLSEYFNYTLIFQIYNGVITQNN